MSVGEIDFGFDEIFFLIVGDILGVWIVFGFVVMF